MTAFGPWLSRRLFLTRFAAGTRVAFLALATLSTLAPELSTCFAQGTAFTCQGRLSNGANPANNLCDLRFAIFDSSDGSNLIAGPITNSSVDLADAYPFPPTFRLPTESKPEQPAIPNAVAAAPKKG